ncbi:MAG: ABC transporter ATP-binding protein [Synergistaceae bacterium]|nr:ABC transporter ATP-binding protein [Synergistaceae bacterium]
MTKNFGGLTAVSDVSFDVPENSIVGLIGPNGSGKTTLFNLISGVYPVTAGAIHFRGKDITSQKSFKIADYGLVRTFQVAKPFDNISSLDNVVVGAFQRYSKRRDAERKALEIMERLDIAAHKDALPKNLPLAIKKRLEIARILATEPKMILLDEVMGGLNPQETEHLMAMVKKIHASGITILIIEHKMKCIMELSHNVVILNNGRVIAHGAPEDVVKNPEVIKAYLGEDYNVKN